MSVCLLILLTGCATERIVYKTEKLIPPALLLRDCQNPLFAGETFRDLALHTAKLQSALDQCQADKDALQEWGVEE
jgi:hypothetical protein